MATTNSNTLTLHEIAHARAGDKGNHSNISVFVYEPADYDLLVEQVTEERVMQHFSARSPTVVRRYLLPNLGGLNLVLEDILDGGVNDSLNLDSHGKTLSFHLLTLAISGVRDN